MEVVVHLCAKNSLKELLMRFWGAIGEQIYRDFEFENVHDFYYWNSRFGRETNRRERNTHSWTELQKETRHVQDELIPPFLKRFKVIVPLLLMVYPHRVKRNIVMWYDIQKINPT